MRTTLDIEPDVIEAAKSVASSRGISLGKAISALIRESFARPVRLDSEDGFPVMPSVPGSISLDNRTVAELLDEDGELGSFLVRPS
ncbi:MAG: DUF6364 family protein [Bryobacteraceae bacterium]